MIRLYRRLAVTFFGSLAANKEFTKLKPQLQAAGIQLLLKTYVSVMFLTAVVVYAGSLLTVVLVLSLFPLDASTGILLAAAVPTLAACSSFAFLYVYPAERAKAVRKSLENDLPFAVSHMSAIASSGIPPEAMFELLTGFREYTEVARHASLVVRNIRTFGMSSVSAIKTVADASPSPSFAQVLTGITFTMEKGGNLPEYLNELADKHLFDYRIRREKYLKTLSTYADIYTALLVAAPLMMLAILGILSVIGGEIIGFTIPELITFLTFVILPFMNIAFLAFIHLTYPGV